MARLTGLSLGSANLAFNISSCQSDKIDVFAFELNDFEPQTFHTMGTQIMRSKVQFSLLQQTICLRQRWKIPLLVSVFASAMLKRGW